MQPHDMHTLPVVYVAGPFRPSTPHDCYEQEMNIREAEHLAWMVWNSGNCACICPHANTRFFQGSMPDDTFLHGDLAILSRCDAIIMLERWRDSQGAREEHAFAKSKGIPVFYDIQELRIWLEGRN